MKRYCLTYDINGDISLLNSQDLRLEIVELLKKEGIKEFESPTRSTILFTDSENNPIEKWDQILSNFKNDMFYYLCSVDFDSKTHQFIHTNHGNSEHDSSFRKLIRDVLSLPKR